LEQTSFKNLEEAAEHFKLQYFYFSPGQEEILRSCLKNVLEGENGVRVENGW